MHAAVDVQPLEIICRTFTGLVGAATEKKLRL